MTLHRKILNSFQSFAARRMFTRWATGYEEEVTGNAYSAADAVTAAALRLLGADGAANPAIADIGIGTGLLAQQLCDALPCRITGLDFAEDMMAQCAARDITELLVKCDVGRDPWPLPDGSYDAVLAAGLFEYLTEDMSAHFLNESARVLAPGGLIVFTYIPKGPNDAKATLWPGRSGVILACKQSSEDIERDLGQRGFTILEHGRPFAGCVFHDGSSYDYRLIAARKKGGA